VLAVSIPVSLQLSSCTLVFTTYIEGVYASITTPQMSSQFTEDPKFEKNKNNETTNTSDEYEDITCIPDN
jgi:hypothetical protein